MDASQLKITASNMRCRVAGPTQSSVEDDSSPRETGGPHTNERATALSKLALVKSKIGYTIVAVVIQYPVSGQGEWKHCSAYEVVPGQLCQTLMGMVADEEASDLAKI